MAACTGAHTACCLIARNFPVLKYEKPSSTSKSRQSTHARLRPKPHSSHRIIRTVIKVKEAAVHSPYAKT